MKIYLVCAMFIIYGISNMIKGVGVVKSFTKVAMGVTLAATGASILILKIFVNDTVAAVPMFFGLGLTIMLIGLEGVMSIAKCSEKVTGKFVDYIVEKNYCYPIFQYEFNEKTYEQSSVQYIWRTNAFGMFERDFQYDIYISPRNPKLILFVKKIRTFDIIMILIGLAAICGGVWYLLANVL